MLERSVQSKKRYILAFLLGTFLFLLVIAISYFIAFIQFGKITDMQGVTAYSLFEKKLSYSFFNEDICNLEGSLIST